jgi:hypothetical protein
MAITFASNAQIVREPTTPQTIGSQIQGFSQVTSINTVLVPYTAPTPLTQPNPIDGDTTTEGSGVDFTRDRSIGSPSASEQNCDSATENAFTQYRIEDVEIMLHSNTANEH